MTPAGEHRRPLRLRIPSGMPDPRNAGGCRFQAHNDQTITSSLPEPILDMRLSRRAETAA